MEIDDEYKKRTEKLEMWRVILSIKKKLIKFEKKSFYGDK